MLTIKFSIDESIFSPQEGISISQLFGLLSQEDHAETFREFLLKAIEGFAEAEFGLPLDISTISIYLQYGSPHDWESVERTRYREPRLASQDLRVLKRVPERPEPVIVE